MAPCGWAGLPFRLPSCHDHAQPDSRTPDQAELDLEPPEPPGNPNLPVEADPQLLYQSASRGFVDDVLVATMNRPNLVVQAHKVEAYSEWTRLLINNTKCVATTAILHGEAHK